MPASDTPPTGNRYSTLVQGLRAAVLAGPGRTQTALRRAVAGRAAALGGGAETAEPVPADLTSLVDKIARHAYRVTNQDVAALRTAGYSEDEVFEIAVSAALGAGLGRLDRGLAALKGEV